MKKTLLGSIIHLTKGKKPHTQATTLQNGFLPYVDIKAFEKGVIDNYADPEKCLLCEAGDILMVCDGARSGFVGKAIPGVVCSTLAIVSAEGCNKNYLFYYLQSIYQLLNTRPKGTGTPHVNLDILMNSELLVPPLAEQERIVAKIEELFSQLDAAVDELKKAKEKLNVYRQAVFSSVFNPLRDFQPLKNYFDITGGLTKNPRRSSLPDKRPYLRVANVYFNKLDLEEIKYIGVTKEEIEKCSLQKDDLLFVEGNGSKSQIGRIAMWDGSIEGCLHQNHLIKGRHTKGIIPRYAMSFFLSAYGRKQILDAAKSTSGLYTLSVNKIKALKIPYCREEKQNVILERIDAQISECEAISKTIEASLMQASALRQSILKLAFEGKL